MANGSGVGGQMTSVTYKPDVEHPENVWGQVITIAFHPIDHVPINKVQSIHYTKHTTLYVIEAPCSTIVATQTTF